MKKVFYLYFLIFLGFHLVAQNSSELHLNKGVEQYSKGNYEEAIVLFKKAIETSVLEKDKITIGKATNNIANSYSQIGKSELALKYYLKAIDYFNEVKDTFNSAKSTKNIGALYSEQKEFEKALGYYQTALSLAQKINDIPLLADCYNNMGVVYEQENNLKKAIEVYTKALSLYRGLQSEERESMVLNNLAIVWKNLNDYPKAINYYNQAITLSQKVGDQFMVAANQNNLGNVYVLTGEYQKSFDLCLLANTTAKKIGAKEIIIGSYDGLATASEKLKNYEEALSYRKLYEEEKDSYINLERSEQLVSMQVKYETAQKEAAIKIKNLEIKEKQLQITNRNYWIFSILLFLVVAILFLLHWKSKQKLKNQIIKDKAIRETEEQERIRIAKDIHDDLGSGLSKIKFLSEIIHQKTTQQPDVQTSSQAVKETANKMIENMRDLIWALNPENTTLANLIARMREYTTDYLEDYPIEVHYDLPENIPQTAISKESHRELFMVIKESLNNIVKHSNATLILFSILLDAKQIRLTIKDNGQGFSTDSKSLGNGLRNMQSRLTQIGGKIEIESKINQGTSVDLVLPLSKIVK